MDANAWANNQSSAAKPDRRQNIFGGTLGGPIVKNTVFFFADYQGYALGFARSRSWSRSRRRTVAPRQSLEHRNTTAVLNPGDPRGLFAGNQVPVGRISPIAAGILRQHRPLSAAQPHPGQRHQQLESGDRLETHHARIRPTAASTGTPRPTTRSSDGSRGPRSRIAGGKARAARAPRQRHHGPVPQPGGQLEPGLQPSLVNEVLVGYNQIDRLRTRWTGPGIGNANAAFGIAGGQPIPGLSSIGGAAG